MADINTVLRRAKVEAPNTRNQQQVLAYVPLANGDTPGIVKPDGEQFYVDADGTLHVNPEYVRRINDISFKYDTDGNTIVTVLFNDETTDEFLVKKGDTGLPYILSLSLITMNTSEDTRYNFARSSLSRTPVIGDVIFSKFLEKPDNDIFVGLFRVTKTSYGSDGGLIANTVLVSCANITGRQGDKGDRGNDGNGITDISKVATSVEGNVYKITLSDGAYYEFVAPIGPQGIQGPKGDKFSIDKIYSSVDEMNAGYGTDSVPIGGFVLIDTGNVDDPDNAKLYVKGNLSYRYITDLSGAQGIQGPKGETGATGSQGEKGENGENGLSYLLYKDIPRWTGVGGELDEVLPLESFNRTPVVGEWFVIAYVNTEDNFTYLGYCQVLGVDGADVRIVGWYFEKVTGPQGEKGEKGDPTEVVQATGTSTTAVMSQKAVTDAIDSAISNVDEKELVKAVDAPLPTPTETSPYIVYNDNKAYVREHFSSVYLYAPAEEYTYYYIYEYQASANDTIQYGIAWTKLPISTIRYKSVDNNNRYQYVAVGGDYSGAYRAVNQLTSGYSLKYFSTIEEAELYIKSSSAKYALYDTNIAMQYKNNIMFGGVWKFTFPIVRSNATNEVSYSTTGGSNATIIYKNANSSGSIDGTVVYGDVPQSRYKELAKIDEVMEAINSAIGTAITTTLNTAV